MQKPITLADFLKAEKEAEVAANTRKAAKTKALLDYIESIRLMKESSK